MIYKYLGLCILGLFVIILVNSCIWIKDKELIYHIIGISFTASVIIVLLLAYLDLKEER